MPKAICEDCGSLVEAELTHNGVCPVGHYVHCGWGHQLSPDDLISDATAIEALTEQLNAARADAKEAEAYAEELEKELNLMKTAGIVEVAIRNPSVMEYMKHWEGRVETAEAKLAECLERNALLEARLGKAVEGLRDAVDAWDNHNKTGDMMQGHWVYEARATLAEIESSEAVTPYGLEGEKG